MNLSDPVVRPIVSTVSTLAPTPLNNPELLRRDGPQGVPLTRERILQMAEQAGKERGLKAPPGALYYVPGVNAYGVGFFAPGHDHGDVGLGNAWLYYNANTGKLAGSSIPGEGSAGDIFMQAQFPLHSGRIIGIGGRILISAVGLVVAVLSITGLMIWLKKLGARRRSAATSRSRVGSQSAV
jgi:uncharacterized iron-regulated membrane protein